MCGELYVKFPIRQITQQSQILPVRIGHYERLSRKALVDVKSIAR